MSAPHSLRLAIVGGGPAGTGPLVHAANQGRLEALLARGVAVIEMKEDLCSGAFETYAIESNTLGGSFLECLDGPFASRVFSAARRSEAARALATRRDAFVPLSWVGSYLSLLGRGLMAAIEAHAASQSWTGHRALAVQLSADGGVRVRIAPAGAGSDRSFTLRADSVLLALGGHQTPSRAFGRRVRAVARRRSAAAPAIATSDELLRSGGVERLAAALRARGGGVRVRIVGGSHSGFYVARALLDDLPRHGLGVATLEIAIRRRPGLFYPSREAARADGYHEWTERDVCPLTGRVHRLGGLRGQAKELCRALLHVEGPASRRGARIREIDDPSALLEWCVDSDLVVPALGYRPRRLPIFDASGRRIRTRGQGELAAVDDRCRVLDEAGTPIRGVYAMGLGTGFRPDGPLGGEPSFRGQTNGLWLYQHGIGRIVLDQVA